MNATSEATFHKQPAAEGLSQILVWEDGPTVFHADHTHPGLTAHILLDGEMTITTKGNSQIYLPADRLDVETGAVRSARMAPCGCRCLVGVKRSL